jgi:hypothetical protein
MEKGALKVRYYVHRHVRRHAPEVFSFSDTKPRVHARADISETRHAEVSGSGRH